MSKLLRSLAALPRRLDREIANRLDRFVLDIHAPFDPGDGTAVCRHCTRHGRPLAYPCKAYVEAADRLAARMEATP